VSNPDFFSIQSVALLPDSFQKDCALSSRNDSTSSNEHITTDSLGLVNEGICNLN
jgi:hypothetical protein